jgi:hypothetical protein
MGIPPMDTISTINNSIFCTLLQVRQQRKSIVNNLYRILQSEINRGKLAQISNRIYGEKR